VILDGNGDSREQAVTQRFFAAACDLLVKSKRRLERAVGVEVDDGVERGVSAPEALEVNVQDIDGLQSVRP
jgi:hypothetical protein